MKKIIVLSTLILAFVVNGLSQKDTTFLKTDSLYFADYQGFIIETSRCEAGGYALKKPYNPNQYTQTILFFQSDGIMAEFECYDKNINNKNTSSNLTIKNGKYEDYYLNGERKTTCFYKEGVLDGKFTVYYQNGNIKRSEIWEKGVWKQGICYDENGTEKPYCAYHEEATYVGGLSEMVKFLGSEVKYPKVSRNQGTEGTVYLKFIVEKDGSISNIKIVKGVDRAIDKEAIRVIKAMPKWKPGKFEGEVVRYTFFLPLKFELE